MTTIPVPAFVGLDHDEALRRATDEMARLEALVESAADDAQLLARLAGLPGGPLGALALIVYGIPSAFRPEEAGAETGLVEFRIDVAGVEHGLRLSFGDGSCAVLAEAGPGRPDAVIMISVATFLRIAFKYLDGNDAYLRGETDLDGDVFLATSLDQWFAVPSVVDGEWPVADGARS
ncbi:SCP2 sterol-binding domain-containing protein [Streptomyces sp. NPDC051940]|uniref:SCP2 sterol-binding domain-containing protein n=1 Tax=Streptomyces sp. NPDC051940 TaxID=3155675 RepID=UPI003416E7EC